MTGVQEEIPVYSPGTSPGKPKKTPSISQSHFHCENSPAINETDQILLAPQQLASNSNSANFNNNLNSSSKVSKSLTTTMPTFDGQSEEFEMFGNLFQTSSKIHNQLTEENKMNNFHSLMRGDTLQTCKESAAQAERS